MEDTEKKIKNTAHKKVTEVEHFYSSIIPESFQLGGLRINVRLKEKISPDTVLLGAAHYPAQEIYLDPTFTDQQMVEQAFFHELVHWILFMMGEGELNTNEKFVDVFAHLLYQAQTTAQLFPDPEYIALMTGHDDAPGLPEDDAKEIGFNSHSRSSSGYVMPGEYAEEEEHHRACQEAGLEDMVSYGEGMQRSEDDGWFYGDE